jgi:glycosyltransferase involved in cell wall biosynthesis
VNFCYDLDALSGQEGTRAFRIAVVIPAFNEAESIGKVLSEIPGALRAEVVVVNNNSADATPQLARQSGAIVIDEQRQGYGYACLAGVKYLAARATRPDIVVFVDADNSDYPSEMSSLVEPIIKRGYDLVLGCRVRAKMEKGAMPVHQRFGNWLATSLIWLFYGVKFRDLGPFRAIKLTKLMELGMRDTTYGWPIEMQLKAVRRRMTVCEVSVSYRKRIGRSKISGTIRGTALAGIKIIGAIFKYRWT